MNLLQMSFSGAAFIITVVIIRAVAINKLPKKTFLVLWELVILRLLIPFSIPSMFSIYTLVTHSISSTRLPGTGTDYNIPTMQGLLATTQGVEQPPADISSSVSMWFIVWCAGIILIALFFVISYLRCLIEFRTALPVHNHYVEKWLAERPLKRPIWVRQSDRISAPLTYGIFRPVILMPKKTDWKNEKKLQYILLHEYVHIYRYDTVTKLIATLALCIHWFNPFVWVMYILFNRDIELACDESVIRQFGENSKKDYSLMLISMEATKSGLLPFCSNFSKNSIEERITAIMKTKKITILSLILAVILVIGTATIFATSAQAEAEMPNSNNNFIENTAAKTSVDYDETKINQRLEELETIIDDSFDELCSGEGNADSLNAAIEAATDEQLKLYDMLAAIDNANYYNTTYGAFGLAYQLPENQLYYNGKRVQYFFDNQSNDSVSYQGILWSDPSGDILLEVKRDSDGNITDLGEISAKDVSNLKNDGKSTGGDYSISKK